MEKTKQIKKQMKRVKEKYFGTPNQVKEFHKYTPFYQDIERIAIEEGLQFGADLIREGLSGWTDDQVQPLICTNRTPDIVLYPNQEPEPLEDTLEDWHLLGNAIPDYGARIKASEREVVAILEPRQFFIRGNGQFRDLERKLREVYRIGYHIIEAEDGLNIRTDPIVTEIMHGAEEVRIPVGDFKKFVIRKIRENKWLGKDGTINRKEADEYLNGFYCATPFSDAFDERREQLNREWDSEKKKFFIVPANYDPDAEKRTAEKSLKDFKKELEKSREKATQIEREVVKGGRE